MVQLLDSRQDFTLQSYRRVAWHGETVRFGPTAKRRLTESRAAFLRLLDSDEAIVIYGVTSGYGQMAHLRFDKAERKAHARQPMYAAAASFGEAFPERIARGVVLARLANYVEGHAAISPAVAEAVAGLLDGAPLPPVPAMGNLSPGEILPLAHLFLPLAEGLTLEEKDGLALVNGSPLASALIADGALAARARLEVALDIFALSIEALSAPLGAYDPGLEALWGDPHETAVLRALAARLEGSAPERRPYQAPVSWRILPRVLGQAERALAQAEEVAAGSLGAVTDNPVFLPPETAYPNGRVVSTGGFHNAQAYPALDALAGSWADLALLCDRMVTKLMTGSVSLLPDNLKVEGGGYMGTLGFTALGFAEQARQAAQRTFLPGSEGGGFGQNDVAAPTALAWHKERQAADCFEACLACLAAVASQAFHVTARQPAPPLRPLLEALRDAAWPMTEQRAPGPDAGALCDWLRAKIFAEDRVS